MRVLVGQTFLSARDPANGRQRCLPYQIGAPVQRTLVLADSSEAARHCLACGDAANADLLYRAGGNAISEVYRCARIARLMQFAKEGRREDIARAGGIHLLRGIPRKVFGWLGSLIE